MHRLELPEGVEVLGSVTQAQAEVLSDEALEFLANLHREFNPRRLQLLQDKKEFEAEANGYGAVKHQSFVGAGYFDEITSICGGTSTQALRDSTEEHQFSDTMTSKHE